MPPPNAPRRVKVLRPQEGEAPKIRVVEKRAAENRSKALSSSIPEYFDYSKQNAKYDKVPPARYTDHRGASCAAAGRATTMDKVLNPTKAPYSEPPPLSRGTVPATAENLARGRGRINIFGGKRPEEIGEDTSVPPLRCQTSSAVENMRRSQSGSMSAVIVHSADFTDPQRPLRGDSAAAANADRARGSSMAATMDHRRARVEDPPAPRCPSPQALAHRERARGVMDKAMSGQLAGDTPPRQRLGPGSASNARREGGEMSQNLRRYGNQESEPPPAPRVKPEAARYAAKNAGTLTQLQYDYQLKNGPREGPEPATRTRPGPAGEIKSASQGAATRNLFTKYGQLPGDLKPKAKVQPRGRKIARLSSGSRMSEMLSPPKPRRVRRRPKSCGV